MLSKVDKYDYPGALTSPVLTSIGEKDLMRQLAILNYHTSILVITLTKMHFYLTKRDVKLCENLAETEIFFLIGASSKALVRALGIDVEPNETFVLEKGYINKAHHAVFKRQAVNSIFILRSQLQV